MMFHFVLTATPSNSIVKANSGVVRDKRTRRPNFKSKTGCKTCKVRRIKCDESKPHCSKCTSTGRKCDGYPSQPSFVVITQTSACSPSRADESLHTLARSPEEARYLQYYFYHVGPKLSGNFDSDLWMRLVLQFAFEEPAIRHATMAIGYLYEKEIGNQQRDSPGPVIRPDVDGKFFLKHYSEAITSLVARMQIKSNSTEISLVTCILFICLELIRRRDNSAKIHIKSGLDIVANLRSRRLIDPSSASPKHLTPPEDTTLTFVEENLVPVLARMTMTAYLSGEHNPQLYSASSTCAFASLPSIPRTFPTLSAARLSLIDLMNIVLLFITSNNGKQFKHGIFTPTLLTPQDLAHLSRLRARIQAWSTAFEASVPSICTTPELRESATVLCVLHTVASVWSACCTDPTDMAYDAHLPAFKHMLALITQILTPSLPTSPTSTPSTPTRPAFTLDIQLIVPLYFLCHRCRDPSTRRAALRLLHTYPRREGLWETRQSAALAARIILREEEGMAEGARPAEGKRINDAVFLGGDPVLKVAFFARPRGAEESVWWWEEAHVRDVEGAREVLDVLAGRRSASGEWNA